MKSTHRHPCLYKPFGCPSLVECAGVYRRNHDGYPEAICDCYHLPNGTIDELVCEACSDDLCVVCGQVVKWEGHDEACSQYEGVSA